MRINIESDPYKEILGYMSGKRTGTRVQVCMKWEESKDGHAFVAEKTSKGVRFVDPQAGTVYNKIENYLQGCNREESYYFRTDKLDISQKGIAACVREEE